MDLDTAWPARPAPGDVIVAFTVPGGPQVKQRHRTTPAEVTIVGGQRIKTRKARTYTPAPTVDFEANVGWRAVAAMPAGKRTADAASRFGVLIVFSHTGGTVCKPGDVDNYAKAVLDGLNRTVYADDSQVDRAVLDHQYHQPVDRTDVLVFRRPAVAP